MITDPKIAGVMLQNFKANAGGGNSWEYLDKERWLRFTTYPGDSQISSLVKISKELRGGGGFTHLATVHFEVSEVGMQAVDITFGGSQKFILQGEESFIVGGACFSKEWNEHMPSTLEMFRMTWNNEKPFKENATYSSKEIVARSLPVLEIYNEKRLEIL